jgi:hypothetical protein
MATVQGDATPSSLPFRWQRHEGQSPSSFFAMAMVDTVQEGANPLPRPRKQVIMLVFNTKT